MKREVIWTWAAEMDAQEAFVQMEEAVEGSGLHLIQLVDQLIQLLREFPHMVTVWHSPIRKVGLRKTKYGLFYVPESTRLVIIGVQDLRAAPDRLSREMKRRLP